MLQFLIVGAGGAAGAMFRYGIGLIPLNGKFPFITLIINFIGSFAIGIIVGAVTKNEDYNKNLELFLKVGVCGGFTTFSTFSLETLNLLESGSVPLGIGYALISVICCVAGVMLGKMITTCFV